MLVSKIYVHIAIYTRSRDSQFFLSKKSNSDCGIDGHYGVKVLYTDLSDVMVLTMSISYITLTTVSSCLVYYLSFLPLLQCRLHEEWSLSVFPTYPMPSSTLKTIPGT